jgi:hypothetical protein
MGCVLPSRQAAQEDYRFSQADNPSRHVLLAILKPDRRGTSKFRNELETLNFAFEEGQKLLDALEQTGEAGWLRVASFIRTFAEAGRNNFQRCCGSFLARTGPAIRALRGRRREFRGVEFPVVTR